VLEEGEAKTGAEVDVAVAKPDPKADADANLDTVADVGEAKPYSRNVDEANPDTVADVEGANQYSVARVDEANLDTVADVGEAKSCSTDVAGVNSDAAEMGKERARPPPTPVIDREVAMPSLLADMRLPSNKPRSGISGATP
jgi:hypothetical protein